MKDCTPKNIWNFAQNKPSLIVDDIVAEYPDINRDFVYEVLLRRGVFKWFAVRRDLIKLKDYWKRIIANNNNRRKNLRDRGRINQLVRCREQVRALCHSDRFVAPDIDSRANKWLRNKGLRYFNLKE